MARRHAAAVRLIITAAAMLAGGARALSSPPPEGPPHDGRPHPPCWTDGGRQTAAVNLSNGVRMPCVQLGTGDRVNQTEINVRAALKAGFRGIDTALTYFDQGGVAEGIAAAAKEYPREELFITTKVPGSGKGVDAFKSTLLDAAANLKLLKLDYVDLLLVHWSPLTGCALPEDCAVIQQQWAAMEQVH